MPYLHTEITTLAGLDKQEPVAQLRLRVAGGPWQPMQQVGQHYEATFETPDAGYCEIEIEASIGANVDRDTILVGLL